MHLSTSFGGRADFEPSTVNTQEIKDQLNLAAHWYLKLNYANQIRLCLVAT